MTWLHNPSHNRWLDGEGVGLLEFARGSLHPQGGFARQDSDGEPELDLPVELWVTCRMTHCFALGHLLGRPEYGRLADHGLAALTTIFKDSEHGGWFASVGSDGPVDDSKAAYAHAFVVLAASSATAAGRAGARELLDEALAVLDERFWDDEAGMSRDLYSRDWSECEPYRGINANMHTVEALIAAADVTGERRWLDRAVRIATKAIAEFAAGQEWRLPEHFDTQWSPLLDYNSDKKDDPFRPYGATIGHWIEWSRLVLSAAAALGALGDTPPAWMREHPVAMLDAAWREGWAVDGAPGFVYTVDWDGTPVVGQRMHWVAAEAVGAAAAAHAVTGDARFDDLYAQTWEYISEYLIDEERGSWIHELDVQNEPAGTVWPGKADAYHAFQATLIPRLPLTPCMSVALRDGLLEA
ncbi:AGE family epimerase/isomerase [Micrococcales bacterium 31B]|nr:AGE family epimerase/isomerase [Micrococcales bacterium 31B]